MLFLPLALVFVTGIEVEERAAVMEFDGKLSRDEAERAAIAGAVKDCNN